MFYIYRLLFNQNILFIAEWFVIYKGEYGKVATISGTKEVTITKRKARNET